ncbi:hypothetical protein [Enterovibrio calviensis]|nr:hypothetical protein [Enterovibrio calviensis]
MMFTDVMNESMRKMKVVWKKKQYDFAHPNGLIQEEAMEASGYT